MDVEDNVAGTTRTETVPVTSEADAVASLSGRETDARGRTYGRYVVLEKLGAGGMGVVFAAWDQTLDRKVALKLIHADRLRTAARRGKAIERLVNEARALAKLDHPNVVRVIEVNSDNDQVFIAMEFVE
ncbi:MAG: protein kinase domain-containing protein, partial [Nannocystaceae bacterium]